MMHGLIMEYKKILMKKTIKINEMEKKKEKLLVILWIKLKNNSSCKRKGYNFVKNEYNS